MQTLDKTGLDSVDDDDASRSLQQLTALTPATGVDSTTAQGVPASLASRIGFRKADIMVLACVSMWAINVPFVKTILQYFEPLETSIIRFLSGGIIFALYVWWREGSLKIERSHILPLAGAGLVGITLNQVFFVYALKNTSSSEVSLIMAITPTVATLLAWFLGQEKIRLNFWISLPLAIAGVALIILTAPGAKLGGGLLGEVLAVCTASSWAAYTVMLRPLLKHYSAARASAYILLFGSAFLLPFGAGQFDFGRMATVPPHIWLALIYCSLAAVVVTNILWFTGVKELGAPRTAFYAYLQPFLGVLAAALILGEAIVPLQIGGGILVVLSMLLYRMKLVSRRRSQLATEAAHE